MSRFPITVRGTAIGERWWDSVTGELPAGGESPVERAAHRARQPPSTRAWVAESVIPPQRQATARGGAAPVRRDLHDGWDRRWPPSPCGPTCAERGRRSSCSAKRPARRQGATPDLVVDVRRLVGDLRPTAIDEIGFAGAMQEQARRIAGDHPGLRPSADVALDLPVLPAAGRGGRSPTSVRKTHQRRPLTPVPQPALSPSSSTAGFDVTHRRR